MNTRNIFAAGMAVSAMALTAGIASADGHTRELSFATYIPASTSFV